MKMPEELVIETQLAAPCSPQGPTVFNGGVNFSLYSRTATRVELLFFDRVDDAGWAAIVVDRSDYAPAARVTSASS